MILKELKVVFKVIADVSILVAILDILGIIEVNPKLPYTGLQLIYFAIIPYLISAGLAYLSYRYESRFKR